MTEFHPDDRSDVHGTVATQTREARGVEPGPPATTEDAFLLGRKSAFAHAAVATGVLTFLSLLGLEKAILAIAFGYLALRAAPGPRLEQRRGLAWAGVILGIAAIVLLGAAFAFFGEEMRQMFGGGRPN